MENISGHSDLVIILPIADAGSNRLLLPAPTPLPAGHIGSRFRIG